MATNGSVAISERRRPYSATMPGATNPSDAGFIVSMTRPTNSTSARTRWAGLSSARSRAAYRRVAGTRRALAARSARSGSRPHMATASPAAISTMPVVMRPLIAMPAIMKCSSRAIR